MELEKSQGGWDIENPTQETLRQIETRALANAIIDYGQGVIGYLVDKGLVGTFEPSYLKGIYKEIFDICHQREQQSITENL